MASSSNQERKEDLDIYMRSRGKLTQFPKKTDIPGRDPSFSSDTKKIKDISASIDTTGSQIENHQKAAHKLRYDTRNMLAELAEVVEEL